MRTYLHLPYDHRADRPAGYDGEVRTPDALVEAFLAEHTAPGDRVLDPFAGFGTTLSVATELGREAVGVEYEPDRVDIAAERAPGADVRQGSALDLPDLPPCDAVFTSPPFMERSMSVDPFANYDQDSEGDYESYLADARSAFEGVGEVLVPGAPVFLEVANMRYEGSVTTLAWDLADAIGDPLYFEGETVVTWQDVGAAPDREGTYGYGYDHSYVLAFRTPA